MSDFKAKMHQIRFRWGSAQLYLSVLLQIFKMAREEREERGKGRGEKVKGREGERRWRQ